MTKWFMLIFFTFITGNFLFAQQNNLEIKGARGNLYVDHTVSAKESFYSIGRMYNVNPKELASFNHLKLQSGLDIGQDLKVPLNNSNFLQSGNAAKGEVLVPVYHTITSGETLYRLGVNYNKVPLSSLKKWNHLSSDAVSVGNPMIVGYLKVNKAESSLANTVNTVKQVAVNDQKEAVHVSQKPAATPEITTPAKAPEVVKTAVNEKVAEQPGENKIPETTNSDINFSGGYFRDLYQQQNQNKPAVDRNGSAGVFKSTSGWQDGKYYCFNNDAAPGTILKVKNNGTGKIVYAKVLDAIPDIKQNSGLAIVISNAAAEELGAGENKFDCQLSYAK